MSFRRSFARRLGGFALAWAAIASPAFAQPVLDEDPGPADPYATPNPSIRVMRDMAYGQLPREKFDVYVSTERPSQPMPVVVMVHGGAWAVGDKRSQGVAGPKAERWVPRGVIVVSVNYPMIPQATPVQQALHVARALREVQRRAKQWGGDGSQVVLMGHSAGAHLVSLITASPDLVERAGAAKWLGTVALDSAAFDVPRIMQARHFPLYDRAFGSDAAAWAAASPLLVLQKGGPPLLAVCSMRRPEACAQARAYEAKATSLGMRVEVLGQPLSHMEINRTLGTDTAYTRSVETFMASLHPALKRALIGE